MPSLRTRHVRGFGELSLVNSLKKKKTQRDRRKYTNEDVRERPMDARI